MEPLKSVIESDLVRQAQQGYGMLVVHTSRVDVYTRLWCVHELDAAISQDLEVSAGMSIEYVEMVKARFCTYVAEGLSDEECLAAAAVKVDTIRATCGSRDDEKMLINIVQREGGFARLDARVQQFRLDVLPAELKICAPDAESRIQALQALSPEANDQDDDGNVCIRALLQRRLQDPNVRVRLAAIDAAVRIGEAGIVTELHLDLKATSTI